MVREAAGRGSYHRGAGGMHDLKVGSRTESWKSSFIPSLTTAHRRLPPAYAPLRLQRPRGFPMIPSRPFRLAWSMVLLYQKSNPDDVLVVERQTALAARGL